MVGAERLAVFFVGGIPTLFSSSPVLGITVGVYLIYYTKVNAMQKLNQIKKIDTSTNVIIDLNNFAKIEQAETIARACINAHSTPSDYMIIICCIADLWHTVVEKS